MSSPSSPRPRLNRIAGPILGEFLIGMTVAMAGLWLASNESDAAAGAFGLSQQVLETLFVLFRVLAIGSAPGSRRRWARSGRWRPAPPRWSAWARAPGPD